MVHVQKCVVNDHPASLEKWCLAIRRCPRSTTEVPESCSWAVPRQLCLSQFWETIPALMVQAMMWPSAQGLKCVHFGCMWVQSLSCASTEPAVACLSVSPGLMEIFQGATAPRLPMWYLLSGLSAEHDPWGSKGVHLHRWGTLINKSSILYFAALAFFRDCYIFVTKVLNISSFFFVFLLFWTWFPLKNEWFNWYGNSPYQNTRQSLSIFFFSSWNLCHSTTQHYFFLVLLSALQIQVQSIENMFKAWSYVSSSLWPTLACCAMEDEML